MHDSFTMGHILQQIELLRSINGCKLQDIVMIMMPSTSLDEYLVQSELSLNNLFHNGEMPIVLHFSNQLSVGFKDGERMSLVVWLERNQEKGIRQDSVFFWSDTSLTISVRNKMFACEKYADILGLYIDIVKYYKRYFKGKPWLNCELAIGLVLRSTNKELVLGTAISDKGTTFSICFKDEIPAEILDELEEFIVE